MPRLETLFFWGNKISGKGCKALATALMKGGCLLRICLFRHGNREAFSLRAFSHTHSAMADIRPATYKSKTRSVGTLSLSCCWWSNERPQS